MAVVAVGADVKQLEDGLESVGPGLRLIIGGRMDAGVSRESQERLGHAAYRQDVVGEPGVYDDLGHLGEVRGLRVLRHAHPAGGADRPHAPQAVGAAAAREDDADRSVEPRVCKRVEKEVDRLANAFIARPQR